MKNILSNTDANALFDILVEQLGVAKSQLTPAARLQEDLGADSLTLIEINMAIEEQFDIEIPDEAAEKISTVEDVFRALEELLGQRRA